jgi:hypothetical protein
VITIDGQEIFREKFRSFRAGLFSRDVFDNNSLFGLDIRLDFGDDEVRVRGTLRPKLDRDLAEDGLTVTLQIGDDFAGADTVAIDMFLGVLWTLDE